MSEPAKKILPPDWDGGSSTTPDAQRALFWLTAASLAMAALMWWINRT